MHGDGDGTDGAVFTVAHRVGEGIITVEVIRRIRWGRNAMLARQTVHESYFHVSRSLSLLFTQNHGAGNKSR